MKARTAGSNPRRLGNTTCTMPCGLFQSGSTRVSAPFRRSSRTTLSGSCAIPSPASTARTQHDEVVTQHARGVLGAHALVIGSDQLPGPPVELAAVVERLALA